MRKKKQNQGSKGILELVKKMKQDCGTIHNLGKKCAEALNVDQTVESNVTVDAGIKPFTVSADFVRQIHSYAQDCEKSSVDSIFKFHCIDCKYKTNKKSNYIDHVAENCTRKPIKNMKCPICSSSYTYRTLGQHLGHYSKGKHISTNEHHAKYSAKDHQILLNSLKELKKTKHV